jgi:hypothetical protein
MFMSYGEDVISIIGLNGFNKLSLRITKVQLNTKQS